LLTVIDELLVKKNLGSIVLYLKFQKPDGKYKHFLKRLNPENPVFYFPAQGLQYCTMSALSPRNKVKSKKFLTPKRSLIRHLSAYKNEWIVRLCRMLLAAINTEILFLKLGVLSSPSECICHCIAGKEAVPQAAVVDGL